MIPGDRRRADDRPPPRAIVRSSFGAALALIGAVLLFLGWYGASGRSTIGEQMPYLASGSIPGAALLVAAAVVLAGESSQRAAERTHRLMVELHSLLVEDTPTSAVPASQNSDVADGFVVVPSGEHYHRPTCALVAGKAGAERVDSAALPGRRLVACPVCEPDQPAV
jgi:hypothetical protein